MTDPDQLAAEFERHRTHLRAVAYRMLGSVNEADDAVQETWLRLSRSDSDAIDNLGGCLPGPAARPYDAPGGPAARARAAVGRQRRGR